MKGNAAEDDISSFHCDLESLKTNFSMNSMRAKGAEQKAKKVEEMMKNFKQPTVTANGDIDASQFASQVDLNLLMDRTKALEDLQNSSQKATESHSL